LITCGNKNLFRWLKFTKTAAPVKELCKFRYPTLLFKNKFFEIDFSKYINRRF